MKRIIIILGIISVLAGLSLSIIFEYPSSVSGEYLDSGRDFIRSLNNKFNENLLLVSKIEIEGNFRTSKDDLLNAGKLKRPISVWELYQDSLSEQLKNTPWIEEVNLEWKFFPLTAHFKVKEAEPWLVADLNGKTWLTSRKGILLQTLESLSDQDLIVEISELPRLNGLEVEPEEQNYLVSANARFAYAVESVKQLELAGGLPFEVDQYTLMSDGAISVQAVNRSEFTQVLLYAGDYQQALESLKKLELVLNDLRTRRENVDQIDLRFLNQAIVKRLENDENTQK